MKKTLTLIASCFLLLASHSFAVEDQITITQTVTSVQCADGTDNDGDSLVDFPADTGCTSAIDDDESNPSGGGPPADTTPPTISSTSPADNATGVSTTTAFRAVFSETIFANNGNFVVKRISNGSVVESIAALSPQVSITGSTLTVTLNLSLSETTGYYIEIDGGFVRDASSNSFAGISGSTTWNFTTGDSSPPSIVNVTATPGSVSAVLLWDTTEPALSTYFWGTTTDYASGSGTETSYITSHSASLAPLVPATTYYFKISAKDSDGNIAVFTGSFTTLAPDTTPPANPSNFSATPSGLSIALSWNNPADPDFAAVKIMRSTVTFPAAPTDGTFVYEGAGTSAIDSSVIEDTLYYYTAFARDTSGNYSSGSVDSGIIASSPPPPPPPPPGGDDDPVLPPIPTGSQGSATSTQTPGASGWRIVFRDFGFIQFAPDGTEDALTISRNDRVDIGIGTNVRVFLPSAKVPGTTRLVVFTLENPTTGKTTAIILAPTPDRSRYEGVITVETPGEYSARADLYDKDNRPVVPPVFGTIRGETPGFFSFIPEEIGEKITETVGNITPVAVPVGVAIGIGQAVAVAANVGSFYDLYLLLLKLIGLLTGLFRKKRLPWGVVYDSVTKRPLDPAVVVAFSGDGSGKKKDAITDLDGRYGFLLKPGNYALAANKTHYAFPSQKLFEKKSDEMYDNLYFGEGFGIEEGEIIKYNIPMDPVGFDWNEFTKNKEKMFHLTSRKERLRFFIFNTLFYLGLALAGWTAYSSPNLANGAILAAYLAIVLFHGFWKRTHRATVLLDTHTGLPIPFAIISIVLPGVGVLMKKVVTDEMGRFYALIEPGTYDIIIEEKQPDESYRERARMQSVKLKKGVIGKNIRVM